MKNSGYNKIFFDSAFSEARMKPYFDRYPGNEKKAVQHWCTKIENNRERDLRDYTFLESLGWRVIVVWECELKKGRIDNTIASVRKQLDANRVSWIAEQIDRSQRREEWRKEIKRRMIVTSTLLKKNSI